MKMDGKTPDIAEENIEKLRQLFPEICCEDKVDFDKLKQVLGEYVDDDKERYNFTWHDKGRALKLSQTPSSGTLRPYKEESKNWDDTENLYIEGDNLEVLKLLQKSYYGKIKIIYIDPPYNTGGDFVYKDDFEDSIEHYKQITQQVSANGKSLSTNTESNGRFHTDWLNMMYSRLRLARNLLTEDGVIFISIGQAENHNLIKICDELFGELNRVGIISRMMKSGGNKGQYFSPNMEYVIVYAKKLEQLSYFREPISDELIAKVYNQIETDGQRKGEKYRIMGLYQAGLDIRPNQRYWIKCPDGSFAIPKGDTYPKAIGNGETVLPTDGDGVWRWSKDRFLNELDNDNILFKKTTTSSLIDENGNQSKWNIYTKIWLNDRLDEGRVPVDIITKWENRISSQELKKLDIPFDFAKPTGLIKYLISLVHNNKDAIILDFFSGSATTAHAVMQLNADDGGHRKFIMVQLPEVCTEDTEAAKAGYSSICEIGKERIRRAGKKIKADIEEENKQIKLDGESKEVPDIGFKVFKLDSSNIRKWQPDDEKVEDTLLSSIDNFMPERTEMDAVYEIMIKLGLDLTYPVEEKAAAGRKIYSIGMGSLMICIDDDITTEVAEAMIKLHNELQPGIWKVVFKDNGFKDDSTKINMFEIFKSVGLDEDAFTTI